MDMAVYLDTELLETEDIPGMVTMGTDMLVLGIILVEEENLAQHRTG